MKAAPLLAATVYLLITAGLVRAQGRAVTEFDFAKSDGTVIRGEYHGTDIPVKTSFGTIAVPTRAVERIQPLDDGKRILLVLRNGDEVVGTPSQPSIPLSTGDGVVRVDLRRSEGIDVCFFAESSREQLDHDLEMHFTFEEGSGSKVTNQARPEAPGRLVQGRRQAGVVSLDGDGDHVVLSNHESFEQLDRFTVSLWVKLRSFAPGGYANEHGYLVNKGNDMWWNPAWCLGYSKRTGAGKGVHPGPLPALFAIGTEQRGGRAKCRLASKTNLETGRWYHLAGSYDGRHASLYVNGRLEKHIAYEGRIRRDKAPLLLGGGSLHKTDFQNHFTTDASIDDLRLYSRALNPGRGAAADQAGVEG